MSSWDEQRRAWEAELARKPPPPASTASGLPLDPLYAPGPGTAAGGSDL